MFFFSFLRERNIPMNIKMEPLATELLHSHTLDLPSESTNIFIKLWQLLISSVCMDVLAFLPHEAGPAQICCLSLKAYETTMNKHETVGNCLC